MDLRTLEDTPPWEWPEDAGEVLLEILHDEEAVESDRVLAAELAGESAVMSNKIADALLSMVGRSDQSDEVRATAVIALGPALENADIYEFEDPDDILISEETFRGIQKSLRKLYMDADVPKEVRRRILEASVRAPQDWHQGAVRAAYSSDDEAWRLTAVFCMTYIRGFEDQILDALASGHPDILYEAVIAAGNSEVDAAWPYIEDILTSKDAEKPLLLAAIEASVSIRPQEAVVILTDLTRSKDEDVVDAAHEAMAMAEALSDDGYDDNGGGK